MSKKHLLENSEGVGRLMIHNEVKTINHKLEKLQKAVPEARIGIAHGQMVEKEWNWSCVISIKKKFNILLSLLLLKQELIFRQRIP